MIVNEWFTISEPSVELLAAALVRNGTSPAAFDTFKNAQKPFQPQDCLGTLTTHSLPHCH
ncbi:MAG: hypothetical protein DRR08_03790 [Candidatus Parabeggiatoa sp. nov. 2]|nr:MAG: hypothetical protein B6247_08460 [Beggiatoa sp. 4572_84]RKZ63324.1 MAG: hypothetical protein DRR08_03790 [Gammaproteobacteria bacterium]HEC86152.1 hypothetical protein [Thioploca sp.]